MPSQQTGAWSAYLDFNAAVADVFFNDEATDLPVYLDLDDDAIAALGERLGLPAGEVNDALAEVVEKVLNIRGRVGLVFAEPLRHTRAWLRQWQRTSRNERRELPAPPVLALLAVFSMAAERMGGHTGMASSNYFGPLLRVLKLDGHPGQERLKSQYRQHVEFFWNVLALWLVGLDGIRGLPSAVALSHRYVGLSMSQALVREHDRRKLPKFFTTYGLDPGREVTPREIEPYLDEWMRRDPPQISMNLATLWKKQPAARERITSVVALELQNWSGSDGDGITRGQSVSSRGGDVRLAALMRTELFRRQVEFNINARLTGHDGPRRLTVASAVGDDKPVLDFVPGVNGWHRLHRPVELANTAILDGVLRLVDEDGVTFERRPRLVLPMRKDEALGQYLEAEWLQLAEDGIVFAVARLAADVEKILNQVARPGFRRVEGGKEGVPEGWTLFHDVQVLGVLPAEAKVGLNPDLNVLQPSISSQLTLAEGLKLPGRLRKYAVQAPPELRAVAVAADHITLKIVRKDTEHVDTTDDVSSINLERVVGAREADGGALMLALADEALDEGDYEALLYVNRDADPVQRLSFYLRSGDSVDLAMWSRCARLAYQPGEHGGRAVISADEYEEGGWGVIDGVLTYSDPLDAAEARPASEVWWNEPKPKVNASQGATKLTVLDKDSCLVTKAHYWELPFASSIAVEGTCRGCGNVKRFPNTPWAATAKKKAREKIESQYHVDVNQVAPVLPGALTWDIGLDALMHTGGGPFSALERIALQIEGSSLFVDKFARTLEALGHVQIKRDARTLEPAEWEIAPAALAELADGAYLLTGYWPATHLAALGTLLRTTPGRLLAEAQDDAPTRWTIEGLTAEQAQGVADDAGTFVAESAAYRILEATPDLSAVEAALPRVATPGARSIRQFHLPSASWVAQPMLAGPGAYSLDSFGSTYVFRQPGDAADGVARVGTAQLVKHLEALRVGRPLIAYRPAEESLDVPIGADLPGLYGRAAVLCSGRLPQALPKQRILRYHNVPADVAELLTARLTH